MRVLLVYNRDAGDGNADCDGARGAIEAGGHSLRAASCMEPGCEALLAQPADLVVVCGGDGTVGRVAKALAGRDVPLMALAAGTANNIALTLGVLEASLEEHLRAWTAGRRVRVDVGEATGPWGTERLIEGFGCGLFASSIRDADRSMEEAPPDESAQRLARALQILKERVGAFPTTRVDATLDGRDVSGDYIVFEAMNTRFVGPNLYLAPGAEPGDGQLDLVLVGEDERETLKEHLASWQRGALQPPPLRSMRGRELRMRWTGFDVHVDDALWPREGHPKSDVPIEIEVRLGTDTVEFVGPA
jgi:diacylglycerol kinase family enzyme